MSARHLRESGSSVSEDREEQSVQPIQPIEPMQPVQPRQPKRKSALRIFSSLLIAAGVVMLLAAGGMWGFSRYRYWRQDQMNKQLATHVTINEVPKTEEVPEKKEAPIDVDWEALKAVNDDIIGWIYVPGTVINYPVYQGESNDSYLRTNALGEYSVGGQVFLDYENTAPGNHRRAGKEIMQK